MKQEEKRDRMFEFYMPSQLCIGKGALEKLKQLPMEAAKACIITTNGRSVKKYGYLAKVEQLLKESGIESILFDKVQANPIRKHVMAAAQLVKKEGCDVIVGLGGGSAIDTAKCVAAMAVNPGDLWDYIGDGSGKGMDPSNSSLPVIAIPTTAGTGSEADPWAVTTNEETDEKIDFGNRFSFPVLSIVDPELMVTVPKRLTVFQGFDALFHATEGYIAAAANPISEILSLRAIELISKNLPLAAADGKNLGARSNMALASTISGIVESISDCTSSHAIAHALSGKHPKLTHGECLMAICLPYYEHFLEDAGERYIKMAEVMGEDVKTFDVKERPRAFLHALERLMTQCGMRHIHMSQYGVNKNRAREYAQFAYDTMSGLFDEDPRRLTFDETVDIIEQAIV
ncbi:iron-containing alcohol dehydrogenase [Sporolactobacillus sp. THM7-7]|nr:iron-containing alcohol dehydrogenase [Sporolactobacillus sp. THM7-7]